MNRLYAVTPVATAVLAFGLAMSGCSTIENFLSGDKIDYRSQSTKATPLEVPPDLTQLARDARYQPQTGVVSATAMQRQAGNAPQAVTAPTTALAALGDVRVERQGLQRWLVTTQSPDKLWPQLRSFWQERGFNLVVDNAELGLMETDWAENRAKLPQDFIRATIGRIFDSAYSTGERDRFRTRVERTANGGAEVFVSHRGMVEVYANERKESSIWQPRPADSALEAEFVARLLVKLGGGTQDAAKAAVASAPDQPARARATSTGAGGATLEVDDAFDRAWRRVGLALDRRGFTVEDRDRSAGLYFVRYIDPKQADQEEPGFFAKLFGGGDKDRTKGMQRYRVSVKAAGAKTVVAVLNSQGASETGEAGKLIVERLAEELR